MRKNIVGFSSTSGRGISKTKALFDHLSLAYVESSLRNCLERCYKQRNIVLQISVNIYCM